MRHYILLAFILFLVEGSVFEEIEFQDIVFVILSQRDPIHEKAALNLESDIKTQTEGKSTVYLTHRDLKHVGDWTVLPLLEKLWDIHEGKFSWVFFGTHQTKVNVSNLMSCFEDHKSDALFIGRGLQDSEPTIIHHFASLPNFRYPLFAAGFAMNQKLLKRVTGEVDEEILRRVDFSIDASHELALMLKNNLNGTLLVTDMRFCIEYGKDCATYIAKENLCEELDLKKIFFAVKTCEKFHKTRVPVVKATWGKRTDNIAFFSDAFDRDIPTVPLNVPNVESGHCTKTETILQIMYGYFKDDSNLMWIILADDDTILRIQKLVSCFDPNELYILGERYGYNVRSLNGYNYITGGGGAAISRAAVFKMSESSCKCPSDSAPDDMFLLGICPQRLNITLVHYPLFHQARPMDYSHEYLKLGDPISFHKDWMIDPVQTYNEWFRNIDFPSSKEQSHLEL